MINLIGIDRKDAVSKNNENGRDIMKNFKLKLYFLLVLFMGVTVIGCNDVPNDPIEEEGISGSYFVGVANFESGTIIGATLDDDMRVQRDNDTYDDFDLNAVFLEMGVTAEQLEMIKGFLSEYTEQTDRNILDYSRMEKSKLNWVNDLRNNYKDMVSNGEISEDEAMNLLTNLNNTVRNELIDYRRALDGELITARRQLTTRISEILDEEQTKIWKEFTLDNHDTFYGPPY